jgi:hypothetical protein
MSIITPKEFFLIFKIDSYESLLLYLKKDIPINMKIMLLNNYLTFFNDKYQLYLDEIALYYQEEYDYNIEIIKDEIIKTINKLRNKEIKEFKLKINI